MSYCLLITKISAHLALGVLYNITDGTPFAYVTVPKTKDRPLGKQVVGYVL
jgi:hypothetical protein